MWKEAISQGDCTSNHSPPTHQKPGKVDVYFLILFTHLVSRATNFYEVKTSLFQLVFETSNLKFFITESNSSCPHLFRTQYLRNCLWQIARWELILDRVLRHLRQNEIL